ncbi:glyoxalase [Gordonia sp. CPCC 205515]|uniref:VOC family protein n=1 Tax=Gordonia sp. CPCC 205515 TaxID=3140791 RepID=UPI003AF3AD33
MMFVNLPVADVGRSRSFFTRLGFVFDPLFCDSGTVCMPINAQCRVMLHRASRFAGYAASAVADPTRGRETVVALAASSRGAVDSLADAALGSGGTPLRDPEDLGFLYCRTFCDLDGHAWEVVWMDPAHLSRPT